ncbi:hypothetical protein BC937DRAFT_93456 [Endogone sp. FLAS-F59071]|eukprot:RUS21158.1 hypothetical protein BC937DRAFT_93456 [Endogone sp. FLAS-F59071]
MVGRR